jgi:hypothetical protein
MKLPRRIAPALWQLEDIRRQQHYGVTISRRRYEAAPQRLAKVVDSAVRYLVRSQRTIEQDIKQELAGPDGSFNVAPAPAQMRNAG